MLNSKNLENSIPCLSESETYSTGCTFTHQELCKPRSHGSQLASLWTLKTFFSILFYIDLFTFLGWSKKH
jgi:hypothetical protein